MENWCSKPYTNKLGHIKTELLKKRITYELIPLFLIVISCGSGMTAIGSSDFKKIDSTFSGTFKNLSYKTIREQKSEYGYDNSEILKLFEIKNQNFDSISMSFTPNNSLVIKYSDSTGIITKQYHGEFSKRGFYEIYFRKRNIEIPPLLPIIYSEYDTDRIRISLTPENNLLIDDYRAYGGNILVFGNGGGFSSLYYFER